MWYIFNQGNNEYLGQFDSLEKAEGSLSDRGLTVATSYDASFETLGANSFLVNYETEGEDPPIAFINGLDEDLLKAYVLDAVEFFGSESDDRGKRVAELNLLAAKYPTERKGKSTPRKAK